MINLNGQFKLNTNIASGDKSLSHRALMLAAIAENASVVRNLALSRDVLSTVECLRALGADIRLDGTTATVYPITCIPTDIVTLNCGNSGTTARLLAGLVAGLGVKAIFVGDKSLMSRPMNRVLQPLGELGVRYELRKDCLFALQGGNLAGKQLNANVNSAQVKSAVLLAGLFADGETSYAERITTRNHTELMLAHMGANIHVEGKRVTVAKSRLGGGLDITLPNDPSSIAYGVALAIITGQEATFSNVLLNPLRMGFYRVLQRSGANIIYVNIRKVCGETVGDICVKPSVLSCVTATEQDVCDGIDEISLLATVALTVKGEHVFYNVDELRYKECNRVHAIEHIAKKCNQQCSIVEGVLRITSDGKLPKGKLFRSFDDHRIAMCETVLALYAGGGSVDTTPYDVSFPTFMFMLGLSPLRLGLIGENVSNSRSPILMSYLAQNVDICCVYETINLPRDIPDTKLLEVIDSFHGLNVTMPFKNRVATLLKANVPSVNTVGRYISAQSTDGYGIYQALVANGMDIANASLWIVGAGGAAEACIQELLKFGCKMQVINRTQSNLDRLAEKYGLPHHVENPVGVLSFVPECEFEQNLVLPSSAQFVLAAAYKGQSGLKQKAMERGITVIDGLEMLYNQGAKSFALWTGTDMQNDYDGFERYLNEYLND